MILVIPLCLASLLSFVCQSSKWDSDYLEKDIYYWASGESECVRLSTIYNRTGCATYSDGQEAQLRYIDNETHIETLTKTGVSRNTAVVMDLELISYETIMNLTNGLGKYCKGIIFIQNNDKLTIPSGRSGYSPDSTSPMYYLRPKSHGDFVYQWNKKGTFLMFQEFPFAIITIKKSQSSHIKSLAKKNEELISKGDFGYNFVEFNYAMYAHNTSMECFPKDDCLPVGGYSVWSTFQTLNTSNISTISNTNTNDDNNNNNNGDNSNLPTSTPSTSPHSESVSSKSGKINQRIVMAVTSMDTTALFHQNICRGANANQAGLVAFLAAMSALSGIKSTMEKLEKQVIFAAFDGEAYDLVGSRKFVNDISGHFTCEQEMSSSDSSTFVNGCWQPYSTSLDFLKLDINLIDELIELNQIGIKTGNNRQLYAHYERENVTNNSTKPMNSNVNSIINTLQQYARDIANETQIGFSVKAGDSINIPGTPPSSYWSFVREHSNMTGIVLTDHKEEYNNEWYHSVYDSYYNSLDVEQICMSATLFARILYKLAAASDSDSTGKYAAFNETFMKKMINADCLLVEELTECLTQDMTCDLVSTMASQASDSTPSHYTSVYTIIEDPDITGTPKFLFRYMANLTRNGDVGSSCSSNTDCMPDKVCGGTSDGTYCMDSNTYFHAAVDPNLKFNYDTELWDVPDYQYGNVSSLIWTESMWSVRIGTRFYQKESDDTKTAVLMLGVFMFLFSGFGTCWLSRHCREKFTILKM